MGLIWWVPLVAALLGGGLVMVSNIVLEIFRRRLEAKSLALALRGEMIAIVEIVKIRKYVEYLTLTVTRLKAGHSVEFPSIRIEREYFPIYTENASKIGILPPSVAECLARTYTYANSFLEDATMPRDPMLAPDMASSTEETLEVLTTAVQQAEQAVLLIDHTYLAEPGWISFIRKNFVRLRKAIRRRS